MKCPDHGVEFVFRPPGISKKSGKPYPGFWCCQAQLGPGVFCQQKPPEPQTNGQHFERGLDQMQADEKQHDKDESIARAVALKASVDFYGGKEQTVQKVLQTANLMALWLQKKPLPTQPPTLQQQSEEIALDEIPF